MIFHSSHYEAPTITARAYPIGDIAEIDEIPEITISVYHGG